MHITKIQDFIRTPDGVHQIRGECNLQGFTDVGGRL